MSVVGQEFREHRVRQLRVAVIEGQLIPVGEMMAGVGTEMGTQLAASTVRTL